MKDSSLNISGKIDSNTVALYESVSDAADQRGKDAKDLRYLLITYEKIPAINNSLYENQNLMASYDWDIERAGAYQLGVDAESITEDQTCNTITELFTDDHESLTVALRRITSAGRK